MVSSRTGSFKVALVMATGLALPWPAPPAAAQDAPAVTVAGGYAGVADVDVSLHGFFVEGGHRVSPRLSVVGQTHWASTSGSGCSCATTAWTDLFAGGGLRFTMRRQRVVQPYVQALAGLYRITHDITIRNPRPGSGPTLSEVDNYAAFLFGTGLNVLPNRHIGFRAGFDVQVLAGVLPTVRGTAGVVVPLGRR